MPLLTAELSYCWTVVPYAIVLCAWLSERCGDRCLDDESELVEMSSGELLLSTFMPYFDVNVWCWAMMVADVLHWQLSAIWSNGATNAPATCWCALIA